MKYREFAVAAALCLAAVGLIGCSSSYSAAPKESVKPRQIPSGAEQDDFHWPEGKRAAISLSFDDARLSQVDRGLPVLDSYGVKATFYVSPESVKSRLAGWKNAIADGHEIGNHTLRHPCSGNFKWSREKALEDYSLKKMARELDEANATVKRIIGVRPITFAYPCGQTFVGRGVDVKSYVPLVAQRFVVGRGAYDEAPNDPVFCDLAQATGIELDGLSFEQAKKFIDQAAAEGRWIIFFGHEIGEAGRQTTLVPTLEGLCQYAKEPASGLWIGTVEEIGKYIRQQRAKNKKTHVESF